MYEKNMMANFPKKITLNIWDEEIAPDVLAIVVRELPKKGVIVFNIPKAGMVVVSKKDYRKTDVYDVYIDHQIK